MSNLCDNCVYGERISENEIMCDYWGIVEYSRNCGTYKPIEKNIKEYDEDEGD